MSIKVIFDERIDFQSYHVAIAIAVSQYLLKQPYM